MCMLAFGKSPSQIAKEISLSIKTVYTYRKRVLDKLQMKDNSDIISYALHYGLLK